jgi:hypothetical protein
MRDTGNLSGESDDNPQPRLIDPRCKICRSEHLEEINQLIIEGRPYSEIIAKFPELKLNKNNIYRHKKHFNFIRAGVEKYEKVKQQLEEGAEKVVDDLKALDYTIARGLRVLQDELAIEKPRLAEVWGNLMLRAIKLKHEVMGDIDQDPSKKLLRLFDELLKEED